METKCNKMHMKIVRRLVKFDNCFMVDSIGKCGRFTMMYKNNIEFQIQSFTKWHISLIAKDMLTDKDWLITGFYGHLEASKRSSSWNLLKVLN